MAESLKIRVGLGLKGVKKGVHRIKSQFKGLQKDISKSMGGLAVGGAMAGGGLFAAFKIGDQIAAVDDAFHNLKSATKTADSGLNNLKQQVYDLNAALGLRSATGAAEKLKEVARKSGETGAGLQQLTFQTGLLAKKFGDEEGSLKAQVTLMKTFKSGVMEAGDAVAFLQNQGGDLRGELLESLNEYSVQFKEAGLSMTQTVAAVSSGLKNSWNIDKTVDAFKEARLKIFGGDKSTQEAFKSLGLAGLGEKVRKEQVSFSDALGMIQQKMGGLKKGDMMQVGAGLFGTQWEDAGSESIFGMIKGMQKEIKTGGTMDAMTKEFEDRFSTKWNRGLSHASNAFTSLIDGMKPVVLPLIEWFGKAANKVSWFSAEFKNISMGAGLLTAGFLGLTIAAGLFTVVASAGGLVLAALTSPITLAVGAIAGISYGLYLLEQKTGLVSTAWEKFKQVFEVVVKTLKPQWDGLKQTFMEAWTNIKEAFSGLNVEAGMLNDLNIEAIGKGIAGVLDLFIITPLKSITSMLGKIPKLIETFGNMWESGFSLETVKQFGGALFDFILTPFEKIRNSMLGKWLVKKFGGGSDDLPTSGSDIERRVQRAAGERAAPQNTPPDRWMQSGGSGGGKVVQYNTVYSRDRSAAATLRKQAALEG